MMQTIIGKRVPDGTPEPFERVPVANDEEYDGGEAEQNAFAELFGAAQELDPEAAEELFDLACRIVTNGKLPASEPAQDLREVNLRI